jgi:large subunit ribosomal protein L30
MMETRQTILVRLKKSLISEKPSTRAVAAALGLRKPGDEREHRDHPATHGMIAKVAHLVEVRKV